MTRHDRSIAGLAVIGCTVAWSSWANDNVLLIQNEAQLGSPDAPFVFQGETLQVADSLVTSRHFVINHPARFHIPDNATLTLNGPITPQPGSEWGLEKDGPGTLALASAATYLGSTHIRAGTLHIQHNDALGDGNAALNLYGGSTLAYAPGTTVRKLIQLHPADPARPEAMPDEIRLHVDSGAATQAGTLIGNTTLAKTGAGQLTLEGFAPSLAPIQVRAGTLAVNGFSGGPMQVHSGATLAGIGAAGPTHFQSGSWLSPGPTVGTLSFTGDITFEPSSTLTVDVLPDGQSDRVNVTGAAYLAGHVVAHAHDGDWAPETRYTIVHTQGGLQGTAFDSVSTNFAYLQPELTYDTHTVNLTLRRNTVPLDDVIDDPDDDTSDDPAQDPGDSTVGDVLDDIGDTDTRVPPDPPPLVDDVTQTPKAPDPVTPPDPVTEVHDTVVVMTAPQAREALRQLDGSWPASLQAQITSDSRFLRTFALAGSRIKPAVRMAEGAPTPGPATDSASVWAQTYASNATRQPDGLVHADQRQMAGMIIGKNFTLTPNFALTPIVAVEQSRMQRETAAASALLRSFSAGLVAGAQLPWLGWAVGAAHTWHWLTSRRAFDLGDLRQWLNEKRQAQTQQLFGEVELPVFRRSGTQASVFAGAAWVRTRFDPGTENGGSAALGFDASDQRTVFSTLGLRVGHQRPGAYGPVQLHAQAAWHHAGGQRRGQSVAYFADSPATRRFRSTGQTIPEQTWEIAFGLNGFVGKRSTASLQYRGQWSSRSRDHAVAVQAAWVF